jgi:hypothetical protein
MKKGLLYKAFIYFLSVSFLILMNGFPGMIAEAREIGYLMGEMVSRGEVKFEVKENVWKKVEDSHFPVYQGVKFKTENGEAIVLLADSSQINVGPQSAFSFDQNGRFILSQGSIEFRISSASGVNFKALNLSILRSRPLQATKDPSAISPKDGVTIGSISIHSNGSITVKSIQGELSILNQDRVVLAGLSSNESVTIPSTTVKGPPKIMVAQVGETAAEAGAGEFLGISTWGWVGILAGVAAAGGIAAAASGGGGGKGAPTCP